MVFSIFLAANFTETYVHYIRVGKMKFHHQGVLLLLLEMGKAAAVADTLDFTLLDEQSF